MKTIRKNSSLNRHYRRASAVVGIWGLLLFEGLAAETFSLWNTTTAPGVADAGDPSAVELGVKFRAEKDGYITGLRFFKSAANTGTHWGHLWRTNGTLLATVRFTNESATGWQQVNFSNQIAISANTVYVASYGATNGHYSLDNNYFTNNYDNPPLHAPASASGNGNGTFGAAGSFPANTFNAGNYWVDILYQAKPDITPPTVSSVSPSPGARWVHVNTRPTVVFSEAMVASSINGSTIDLRDASNAVVSATISYNAITETATITPATLLKAGMTYTVTVSGHTGGVTDLARNQMANDYTWTFSTLPAAPYASNTNGPILILKNDQQNPFANYLAEILLAEGLNEFTLKDIATVSSQTLTNYDVVLLGQMSLTAPQTTLLSNWVNAGGQLIAMRPDKQLAGLLGLNDAGVTLTNSYLLANTLAGPGIGIVSESIQYHGVADGYTLAGATNVATLYSTAVTPTVYPAVTWRGVDANGGHAAAFLFDLPQSIVYTRQGNPAWAGQDRDGVPPCRSDDLFYGAATFDPAPDWVDMRKVAIPQADEQQRLLANLIATMNLNRHPLPRFWYFPDNRKAVVVMTGDDHDCNGTRGRFDQLLAASPANATPGDWRNLRATSYYSPYASPLYGGTPDGPPLTSTEVSNYVAAGFEISLHLDTGCADYTWDSLNALFTNQLAALATILPGLPASRTHRCHCVAWSQYTIMAEVERANGIRMDTTYYYWPPNWSASWPGMFTGSGMPMRFATADGSVIDNFQAATFMTDESNQVYPYTVDTLLEKALGPEGFYGAFVCNMHNDENPSLGANAIVAAATNRNVAVISAGQLLDWVDARNASAFNSIAWNGSKLAFAVKAGANARGLQVMAPVPAGMSVSSVRSNSVAAPYVLSRIKGMLYAVFPAGNGAYEVNYTPDVIAPSIVSLQPTNNASAVGLRSSVNIVFSEPLNPATVNASSVTLQDAQGNAVTAAVSYDPSSLTVTVQPQSLLALFAHYTVTVHGGAGGVTDGVGNPLAGNVTSAFDTVKQYAISVWNDSVTPAILSAKDTNAPIGSAELGSVSAGDTNAVELGMKFQSAVSGRVTGVRFYKGGANTGVHIGNLWTKNGTLLARVTFTNETESGWQFQAFASPVAITSNQTYVVSYHAPEGGYAVNPMYFANTGVDSYPLFALADGQDGANSMFIYSAGTSFPVNNFNAANYWVDVTFVADNSPDVIAPMIASTEPAPGAGGVDPTIIPSVTFDEAMDPASVNASTLVLRDAANTPVSASVTYDPVQLTAYLSPTAPLNLGATYSVTVRGGANGVKDLAGNNLTNDFTWSFMTAAQTFLSLWNGGSQPAGTGEPTEVEVGLKFQSLTGGYVTGVRFYKNAANGGIHVGHLWTANGTLLASATFTNETASGWQFQPFATPIPVAANATYVISYHAPAGNYSVTSQYFAGASYTNFPLVALASSVSGGNGVFSYDTNNVFPTSSFNAANYWVDVTFDTNSPPLVITSSGQLPAGFVNLPYAEPLTASGGIAPYHWTMLNGALPSGLTLNSGSGVISGVTTNVGNFTFEAQVADASQPSQTSSQTFTLTTALGKISTLWANSTTPQTLDIGPDPSVELGVKFQSDLDGTVIGVRFYKSATNTGVHTGHLWTSNGIALATAVFTNETASGWQQATFIPPVAIHSNTLYVVSYHASQGHYSVDAGYFGSAGVDQPPLHAPASGGVGGNGVFGYGADSVFPTASYQGNNYWVDVVLITPAAAAHNGPSLLTQADRVVNELSPLTVINTAVDNDVPARPLNYALLVTNAQTGLVVTNVAIDANGVITWTPDETQGPGTNVLVTVVSDGTFSNTNAFRVTVNEVNSPPTLTLPPGTNLLAGADWSAAVTAADGDWPVNPLTFALVAGPDGLTVSSDGWIHWTPPATPTTNSFVVTISVSDMNAAAVNATSLSQTNSFVITVNGSGTGEFRILSLTATDATVAVEWSSVPGNF
jgi:hypothetical protein